ncbi:MAG: hypothetical protein CL472_00010 [Acidobacteria bacterium]|nr:hypothetical protein [Acidobacteriota bacterium]
MQRPVRITMEEAMRTAPDKAGWRPMSCAPRVALDDEEVQPVILARSENDQDLEVVWNPNSNAWRANPTGSAINGRLIAWRPIVAFSEPVEKTMALSLADDCELQAQKHDKMAPFVPQEKQKAELQRGLRDKYLAVANASQ